jgi:hypothetical protein
VKSNFPVMHTEAMKRMQAVYIRAEVVLVLDNFLEPRNVPESREEVIALLLSSSWWTRLWTFSEGSLGRFVWIVFKDEFLPLDSYFSERQQPRLSQLVPTKDPSGMWFEAQRTVETLRSLRHLRPRVFQHKDKLFEPYFLDSLIQSVNTRQTSNPDDEAFCLSLSLGLQHIIAEPSTIGSMQRLYAHLEWVPGTLLLISGERLTEPGYRWAPKTLLGRKEIFRNSHVADHTIRNSMFGIRVPETYHVILLDPIRDRDPHPESKWTTGSAVLIFFRLGDEDFYLRVPEDINDHQSSKAARVDVPLHSTTNQLAVVIRGKVPHGRVPGVILRISSYGDGHADLPTDTSDTTEVELDGGAEIKVHYEQSEDLIMPQGWTVKKSRELFEKRRLRPQTTSHMLTSYHTCCMVNLLDETDKKEYYYNFDLADGYDGLLPWDKDRVVCEATELDLDTTDVWIS